jgi:carbamate kinase
MLTDAEAVYEGWGGPDAAPIRRATPSMLRAMTFPAGSMAPMVEAACRFVEGGGGRFAAIGALEDAAAILRGEKGTRVSADFR